MSVRLQVTVPFEMYTHMLGVAASSNMTLPQWVRVALSRASNYSGTPAIQARSRPGKYATKDEYKEARKQRRRAIRDLARQAKR